MAKTFNHSKLKVFEVIILPVLKQIHQCFPIKENFNNINYSYFYTSRAKNKEIVTGKLNLSSQIFLGENALYNQVTVGISDMQVLILDFLFDLGRNISFYIIVSLAITWSYIKNTSYNICYYLSVRQSIHFQSGIW